MMRRKTTIVPLVAEEIVKRKRDKDLTVVRIKLDVPLADSDDPEQVIDEIKTALRQAGFHTERILSEKQATREAPEICTCTDKCPPNCKGECGCKKCHNDWMDFLSME